MEVSVLHVLVEHIKTPRAVIIVQIADLKKLQKILLAHRKQIVFVLKDTRLMEIIVFNVRPEPRT